ncbi:MAG: hypothetical protein BVN35_13315 [Proteobacteria bacterium ST_bin11]|jgi:hypothetical protein|nr:MAG: hypothetical protein BVN35_13315 [Proteobacteria bacterium ST_bin11]
MTQYPEKSCSIERLVRHPKLVAAALSGEKTQQRRDGLYAYPGETFVLEDEVFEVISVERQRIGDISDADARAEGYPNLAIYKDLILKMHSGMQWNEDGLVWVHSFRHQQQG